MTRKKPIIVGRITVWLLTVPTAVVLYSGSLPAADGVVEINHAAVMAGGITAGDTPGYPATISETGSYRLTGNLQMPDANTGGIVVTAESVSIDLNGFAVVGTTVCTGTPVTSCTPTGSGKGIESSADGTSVSNGSVRGAGQSGVSLGANGCLIDNVRAQDNGSTGLVVNSSVSDEGGTIRNSNSNRNGNYGIYIGNGGLATGNVLFGNKSVGIFATGGTTVLGNTMRSNGGVGLDASSTTGFGHNVMTDNNSGNANPQTDSDGIEIALNVCGFDTTCP